MAITVPQTNNGILAGGTTAVSFAAGIAAGSIIVVAGEFDQVASGVTLSDGHSDAVTDSGLGIFTDATTGTKTFFKAFFSPVTGAQTITASYTGTAPTFADMYIWEVAGLTSAQFDKVVKATGSTSTADSGSSGTLSNANEACFGYGVSSSSFSAAGSGWTSDGINGNTGSLGEHKIVASTTALDATGTQSGAYVMWFASVMSGGAGDVLQAQQWF